MKTLRARALAALLPVLVAGVACSSSQKPAEPSPRQTLSAARHALDKTSGVHLVLSTPRLPQGVNGVLRAAGVGTHAPAFAGTFTVQAAGLRAKADVVAVGGRVYARLPLGGRYVAIDPAQYGVTDPAHLLDDRHGISSLLTATRNPTRQPTKAATRTPAGGGDPAATTISGTVPGRAVGPVLPGAPHASFDAVYTIGADHRLEKATLTGPFYPGARDVTYTLELSRYGLHRSISAP